MGQLLFVESCEKENLKKLSKVYLDEISNFDDGVQFDQYGAPIYKWFDFYWKDKGRYPIYYMLGGKVAGFALVRKLEVGKYEIAEFFVLKEFRGSGNSLEFARLVCSCFCGEIEFSTSIKNKKAVKFWEKFVENFGNVVSYDQNGRRNWRIKFVDE